MRVGRTLPPAAAPLEWRDLGNGIAGLIVPGRMVSMLEEEIRQEFGVPYVFLVGSGKAALVLTLRALQALPSAAGRREVVIPAYTCFSVPAAVLTAGLKPVVCDINPETFDFDREQLRRTFTTSTLCVIAHHLFGVPSAIDDLRMVCEARGIILVEDAAQAMGVRVKERLLGTLGDVGIFSLGRGKNLTCGSGGIIVTGSPEIATVVAREHRGLRPASILREVKDLIQLVLMTIFIRPSLYWIPAALPFLGLGRTVFPRRIPMTPLSGMKAGVLRGWRVRLSRSNRARAEVAAYFCRRLAIRVASGSFHPYLRLPIVTGTAAQKAAIVSMARRRGLGLGEGYPRPVNEIPEMRAFCNGAQFPAAQRVVQTLVTLPTHHWLSENDKHAIVAGLGARLNAA